MKEGRRSLILDFKAELSGRYSSGDTRRQLDPWVWTQGSVLS